MTEAGKHLYLKVIVLFLLKLLFFVFFFFCFKIGWRPNNHAQTTALYSSILNFGFRKYNIFNFMHEIKVENKKIAFLNVNIRPFFALQLHVRSEFCFREITF